MYDAGGGYVGSVGGCVGCGDEFCGLVLVMKVVEVVVLVLIQWHGGDLMMVVVDVVIVVIKVVVWLG